MLRDEIGKTGRLFSGFKLFFNDCCENVGSSIATQILLQRICKMLTQCDRVHEFVQKKKSLPKNLCAFFPLGFMPIILLELQS